MLAFLLGVFRLIWLFGKGHHGVVLENIAFASNFQSTRVRRNVRASPNAIAGSGSCYLWHGRTGGALCLWSIPIPWGAGSESGFGVTGRISQRRRQCADDFLLRPRFEN